MPRDSTKPRVRCDRFIPFRGANCSIDYKMLLKGQNVQDENARMSKSTILSFNPREDKAPALFAESFALRESGAFKKSKENSITIQSGETQVLKAEGFRNDYYTNLLDCKDEDTIISILHNTPYIFCRQKKTAVSLPLGESQNEEMLTSVKFQNSSRSLLAFGSEFGLLRLYDSEKNATEIYDLHLSRIGCLDWNPKMPFLLSSGSKDKLIRFKDLRCPEQAVAKLSSHVGEICGLSWSPNGLNVASGGNDNLVNVWDLRAPKNPKWSITAHKAAVRALCWAPFKDNLLASGGGSGDMRILVHNVDKEKLVKEIATDSQICAISWDEQTKALITGHGFSRYQICLWDYESERYVYEFMGHGNRVLSLVQTQPNGLIVSGSSDETVRVWNVRKVLKSWDQKSNLLAPFKIR